MGAACWVTSPKIPYHECLINSEQKHASWKSRTETNSYSYLNNPPLFPIIAYSLSSESYVTSDAGTPENALEMRKKPAFKNLFSKWMKERYNTFILFFIFPFPVLGYFEMHLSFRETRDALFIYFYLLGDPYSGNLTLENLSILKQKWTCSSHFNAARFHVTPHSPYDNHEYEYKFLRKMETR